MNGIKELYSLFKFAVRHREYRWVARYTVRNWLPRCLCRVRRSLWRARTRLARAIAPADVPVGGHRYPLLNEAWAQLMILKSPLPLPEVQRRVYQALVNQERRHLEEAAGGPVTDEQFHAYTREWPDLCEDEEIGGTRFQEFVAGLEGVQERRQRQRIEQAIAEDTPPTTNEPAKRRKI